MTTSQILAMSILGGMMALFVWGRLRYDLVAVVSLLAAVFAGIVPADRAFSGFSDDIVIIVASALVVSAAVARSGVMSALLQRAAPYITTVQGQVFALVTAVTILSAFVKNIGALAMMIPVAFQMARKSNASPSLFLMPMSFGSLLGGLVTLVGTSPNIIVARLRGELTGQPFSMFDFTPVGLGLAVAGIAFLTFGYRLLPSDRKGTAGLDQALSIPDYLAEARVAPGSAIVGQTISDLAKLSDYEVTVTGIVRNETRRMTPLPDAALRAEDILLLEGEPEALQDAADRAGLQIRGGPPGAAAEALADEVAGVEALVGPRSVLIGQSAGRMALRERYNVSLVAVSRSGKRFTERLRDIKFQTGDVLILRGDFNKLPERLRELGCLPLAEREIRLGKIKRGIVPASILGAAMLLTAVGVLPVAIAFFTAAVFMVLSGALSLRAAYDAIEWPILVMLGALIPVSETIHTTGAATLVAARLSDLAYALPPSGAIGLIMLAAMAVTPFLNNAATVLIMAPIAVSFAGQLGFKPDAFLMAVAIGAACDFLTPIGHQCNTLVMGPGGYRFGDYWRLGAPLSALVLLLGVPLIALVWPVR